MVKENRWRLSGFVIICLTVLMGVGCNFFNSQKNSDDIVPQKTIPKTAPITPAVTNTLATTKTATTTPVVEVADCNDNFDCFINKAQSCSKSLLIYSSKLNLTPIAPMIVSVTTRYEITGMNNGQCAFTMRALKGSVQFTTEGMLELRNQGLSQAEIDEQLRISNEAAKQTTKLTSHCTADSLPHLVTLLKDMKSGKGSTNGSFNLESTGAAQTIGPGVTCTFN